MSEPGSLVQFYRVPKTIARTPLRSFARRLQSEVASGRSFTCRLTRDEELQRLNRQFRGKDQPTDVLSFPSLDEEGYLGDIAISVDRALEQAARFGHSAETEIEILLLHGVLHLLGMDHERDGGRMRRTENAWRRKLNLPAGLIERTNA
jgi:probable rRNA maturation factor